MKKYIYQRIIIKSFLIINTFFLFSCATKMELMTLGENKTKILKHNYIIVNSVDNSPSEVEVSYSVFIKGNSNNIIKTEKLTTPFVIGGEDVRVVYDSLAMIQTKPRREEPKPEDSFLKLKRNYNPKGADYLSIKNLSGGDLEYCAVGNLPIKYLPIDRVERWSNLSNKDRIDKSKVIDDISGSSMPIYKGTPVLYLFRPDLSPETDIFITRGIIDDRGGIKDVIAEKITLKRPTFGEITLNSPMPLSDVAELYRNEYKYGNILYEDYDTYSDRYRYDNSLRGSRYNYFYGKIPKGQTFTNTGQVWFINTYMGSIGDDTFDYYDTIQK